MIPKYRKIPQVTPGCLPYDKSTHTRSLAQGTAALTLDHLFGEQKITEAVSWNATARLAECTVGAERDWKGVEPMSLMSGQALRMAMLASALAAPAWNASAQDGDVAAGRAFAREACITCHVVDPANASPRVVVIGPKFQDIANTKGMTATALRVFLTTSHPKMPNLILTPEEIADVTAYILSLREHQ